MTSTFIPEQYVNPIKTIYITQNGYPCGLKVYGLLTRSIPLAPEFRRVSSLVIPYTYLCPHSQPSQEMCTFSSRISS